MKKHEVKYGAILSYILIIANAVYGFVVAPYLFSTLGESEYGVYKAIGSMATSIMVLDLGIGGTMQRYVAKFHAEGEHGRIGAYAGTGLMIACAINALVVCVCVGLYFSMEKLYGISFSAQELDVAKQIFLLFILQMVLHIFENVLQGIICGLNRFVFTNSLKLGTLAMRTGMVYLLLPLCKSANMLLYISIAVEVVLLAAELLYLYVRAHIHIRFTKPEAALLKESGLYTAMMFVQAITSQINSNLDNVIVASLIGAAAVSVYSFGLVIFNMFQQLSTAISGVMLPTVTKELKQGADARRMEDLVIGAGKIQFLLLGSALAGFCVIGKDFIRLWLGEGYGDVWIITLILMIPAIWELSQNVCLSILRAKNLLGVRTVALLAGMLINILISWFGTKHYGYFSAAVGTAVSITAASLITMNIYYYRVLHLNIRRIFGHILAYALPSILCGTAALLLLQSLFPTAGWFGFAGKVFVYAVFAAAVLLLRILLQKRKRKKTL